MKCPAATKGVICGKQCIFQHTFTSNKCLEMLDLYYKRQNKKHFTGFTFYQDLGNPDDWNGMPITK